MDNAAAIIEAMNVGLAWKRSGQCGWTDQAGGSGKRGQVGASEGRDDANVLVEGWVIFSKLLRGDYIF